MNDPAPPALVTPPRERLDPRARIVWYVAEAVQAVVTLVIIAGLAWAAHLILPVRDLWIWLVAGGIAALVLVSAIAGPAWRYRTWRYEIREDEVDLQHGWLVQTRALIPMSRIQHVDTRRGPLEQRFGLATVVFFTAAGAMVIPGLATEVAAGVRARIAELAKVHDDL